MAAVPPTPFRIVAINGSVRPGNNTARALAIVCDELRRHGHVELVTIDPTDWDLAPGGSPGTDDTDAKLRAIVEPATGIVLATPEYHGSYSAAIKMIIEALGYPSVLEGKCVELIGVASGRIGAVKATEHLRSVCSHIGALVLPGPVSIASVHTVFDDEGRCTEPAVEAALRGAAQRLLKYIHDHICPRVSLEEMVREQGIDRG